MPVLLVGTLDTKGTEIAFVYDRLRAAGVAVTVRELPDVPHGVLRWGGAVARARELVAELGGFVRRVAGDPTG